MQVSNRPEFNVAKLVKFLRYDYEKRGNCPFFIIYMYDYHSLTARKLACIVLFPVIPDKVPLKLPEKNSPEFPYSVMFTGIVPTTLDESLTWLE